MFGSLDGGYDGELWGVVPRILAFKSYEDMMTTKITYRELANAIIEADTADWAEPYEVIRDRVWSGFEDIAHHREKMVAAKSWWFPWTNNFLLLSLIDASLPMQMALENGSVTTLTYEKGTFTIQGINDISYIEKEKDR